jgi:hypothetical protein
VIAATIVTGTIVLGSVFLVAWLVRPDLRAWVEQPKHRFLANLQQYDRRERDLSDATRGE